MADQSTSIAALTSCFDDLESLVDDLADAEWAVRSLCPDWDVRGVVSHLAGIEDLLVGWVPKADDEPPPFQKLAEFEAATADLGVVDFVTRTKEILGARRSDLAATTPELWDQKCMSPIGPATYGRFMDVRVFDFWVHHRDMTLPLGRTTDDGGPKAEIALDEVHQSLGYIAGKKVGLPDGASMAIHVTGGVERDMFVQVDGRAAVVEALADGPTVELTADSTTFVMLACGRVDPQAEIDAGRISWTGDAELGEKAARSLRFTM